MRFSFITAAIFSCRLATRCSPSAWICCGVSVLAVLCTMFWVYHAMPLGSADSPSVFRVAGRYSVAMKPRSAR